MRQFEGLTLHLFAKPGCGLTKGRLITQDRVTKARHLVSHGAGGLVVIGAGLKLQDPMAHPAQIVPLEFGHRSALITERAPWVSSMRKY